MKGLSRNEEAVLLQPLGDKDDTEQYAVFTPQPRSRPLTRLLVFPTLTCLAFLPLISWLVQWTDYYSLRTLSSTTSSKSMATWCDPHQVHGRLHLNHSNPIESYWDPVDPVICPQSRLARSLAKDLIHFPLHLHNKTVLLIGDEVDRTNLENICQLYGDLAEVVNPQHRLWPQFNTDRPTHADELEAYPQSNAWPRVCTISSISLTMVSIFHYGIDKYGAYPVEDVYGKPYAVEERITDIAAPLVQRLAQKIDLVSFSSCFWDLAHIGREEWFKQSQGQSDTGANQPFVSQGRWVWINSRYKHVLLLLMNVFPTVDRNRFSVRSNFYPAVSASNQSQVQKSWLPYWAGDDEDTKGWYFPHGRVDEMNRVAEDVVQRVRAILGSQTDYNRWGHLLFGAEANEPTSLRPLPAASVLWFDTLLNRLMQLP